jgi:hypothetical protein
MHLWALRWFEWQRRALRWGAAAALVLPLMGCLTVDPVQPWEKGNLAKPEMTFDHDPLDKGFKEHIYSSKESASGGSGVGGGGCGCN